MSLLFCLGKSRINVKGMRAQVTMQTVRNEKKRLRVGRAEVVITPELAEEDKARAGRCRELFEEFCTVSQSIRNGIDLDIKVAGLDD
jgi:organic hydroperoxide reductase OsmC/OhrA